MATALASDLDTPTLVIGLAGGLAIFLFGMGQMTDALKKAAGASLRGLLKRLTANRVFAVLTGALVTAVVQSSSVTTVLVVGFVSAGVMTLAQTVGVIFGANVGTTITAQIIAFDVSAYALAMVALGFGWMSLAKGSRGRNLGAAIMGLGLIFFGMGLMGEATSPLRSYEPFIDVMQSMRHPLLAILAGAAFTALVQSSSATTGIVIVLAGQGFIPLEAGIALALGSNVGTCVTALLASIGKPVEARRAATVHVVFNVTGALLWTAFIPQLAAFVQGISPDFPELEGASRLAAETPRQIANAHTLFNVANTLLFLPFTGVLANLVTRLVPEREGADHERRPKFLDAAVKSVPSLAAERIRLEIARMGRHIVAALRSLRPRRDEPADPQRFTAGALDAEALYIAIVDYARTVRLEDAGPDIKREMGRLMLSANHLLSLTDSVRRHLLSLILQAQDEAMVSTPTTARKLRELTTEVVDSLELCVQALETTDPALATAVLERGGHIRVLYDALHEHLERRLADPDDPAPIRRYRFEFALLETLLRVDYFVQRIAENIRASAPEAAPAPEPEPGDGAPVDADAASTDPAA